MQPLTLVWRPRTMVRVQFPRLPTRVLLVSAALALTAVACSTPGPHPGHGAGESPRASATAPATTRVATMTYYAGEGVTLRPAPSTAQPSISKSQALRIYRESAFAGKLRPSAKLVTYQAHWGHGTGSHPVLAWAVVVANAPVVSYGPSAAPAGLTEPFTVVVDAQTGRLMNAFQDQPAVQGR
jgi:hypothetical protein